MRKVVWLTVLMICLAVVPAYAAHWEDQGPVDHNHRDNSQKTVQVTQRADVLMRSNRLKIRDIPVNLHALPIPEDMK